MTDGTVTISRAEYDRLLAEIEDLRDTLELSQAERTDDGARVPGGVIEHLINGDHPVAAWRKYRELSVAAVAKAADVPADDVAAIESGQRDVSVTVIRALAHALDAPIDSLIRDE